MSLCGGVFSDTIVKSDVMFNAMQRSSVIESTQERFPLRQGIQT